MKISAVKCTYENGQMRKLDITITNFRVYSAFVILQKLLAENANKIYHVHVYKVMVVLQILNRILVSYYHGILRT